jgi:hypothetical protein
MFYNLIFLTTYKLVLDKRADEYSEKAVIVIMVVVAGVAAFAAFGNKVVELIGTATGGL